MRPIALSLLILTACTRHGPLPAGLLDHAAFTRVLMESQLIEARINHEMILDKRTDSPVARYYAEMFKQQGTTEAMFRKTFQWYAEHPQELKSVYEDVLTRIQQRADSLAH